MPQPVQRRRSPQGGGSATGANLAYDLGNLEQRVYNTEKGLTTLGERIDAMAQGLDGRLDRLTQAMERKTQPQWQAFSVVSGLAGSIVTVISVIVYLLIQTQIGTVDARVDAGDASTLRLAELLRSDYVPRVELAGWRVTDTERLDRISGRLDDLVTRPEYAVQIAGLTERIGRMEQVYGSTYSIGDVLKEIQDRLQRLEDSRAAARSPPASVLP